MFLMKRVASPAVSSRYFHPSIHPSIHEQVFLFYKLAVIAASVHTPTALAPFHARSTAP